MNHKDAMIAAAEAAGRIVIERYGTVTASPKGNSVVTEADKEVEQFITKELSSFGYGVLGEEYGGNETESEYCWVVDPIDGTTNFSRTIPIFAVSIGLTKEGRAYEGVLHDPVNGDTIYAGPDGVFLNGTELSLCEAAVQTIIALDDGPGKMPKEDFAAIGAEIVGQNPRNRSRFFGSACIQFMYVATGKIDAIVAYGQHDWDYAAGIAICEILGLHVSDWNGERWRQGVNNILVCREEMRDEILPVLQNYEKS